MATTARHNRRRLVHKAPPKLDSVRNEINVTPLVDVCLVLLIIFMVVLPELVRGKEVPLPQTRNHTQQNDTRQPIVVIDQDGQIYVDTELVPNIQTMMSKVEDEWKALAAQNQQLARVSKKVDR